MDHGETEALGFVTQMKNQYPDALSNFIYDEAELDNLHTKLLSVHVDFNSAYRTHTATVDATISTKSVLTTLLTTDLSPSPTAESTTRAGRRKRAATHSNDVNSTGDEHHVEHYHPIEVDLAHYFHYCSITILAILVVEVGLSRQFKRITLNDRMKYEFNFIKLLVFTFEQDLDLNLN